MFNFFGYASKHYSLHEAHSYVLQTLCTSNNAQMFPRFQEQMHKDEHVN